MRIGGEPPLTQDEIDQKIEEDMKELKRQAQELNQDDIDGLVKKLQGDLREKNGLSREWTPEVPEIPVREGGN